MKKRILLSTLALLLAISLVAIGCPAPTPTPTPTPTPAPEKPTYHWLLSESRPEPSPRAISDARFAETVLEASDGRIVIDCHYAMVLGDWVAVFEEVMMGTIEMQNTCLSSVYDPRIGVVYIPYLVTSWEEVMALYTPGGFVYDTVDGILADIGIKLLSSWPVDFMGVGIKGECPPSPKDPDVAKGLKVRVWADPAPEAIMEFFGYMPTVIPFADTYAALSAGTVDGICTNLTSVWENMRDHTDYWMYDYSLFEGSFFIMNLELWNTLSPADQKIILDAALEEQRLRLEDAKEWEQKHLQMFRDFGTEVILFTPEEVAVFRARAIEEIWPELYPKIGKRILLDAATAVEALK